MSQVSSANGMPFIRYFLAFSLIATHFCVLADKPLVWPIIGDHVVKSFFVIAGFYATYSYLRSGNLMTYAKKRFLRTYPLYFCVVALCTVFGWVFSTLSLGEYFTSGQTLRYFLSNVCFLNFVEPSLPGVFTENFTSAVNPSLWFMKVLVMFYAVVPLMVWLMRRLGKWPVLLLFLVVGIAYREVCLYLYESTGIQSYATWSHQLPGQLPYFLAGMAVILYFDVFCRYWRPVLTGGMLLGLTYIESRPLSYLWPLVYAVFIIGIAYFLRPLPSLRRYPDITYGLYLIHAPVVQAYLQCLPDTEPLLLFGMVVVTTVILAYVGWRQEKKVSGKKLV